MTEYGNDVVGYIEEENLESWSDGKRGNYWSNYNGIDSNFDGVGDTPFVIDEKRQDPYPLMVPYNITNLNDIDIQMPEIEQDQNHTTIITVAATLTAAITIGVLLMIYYKKHHP